MVCGGGVFKIFEILLLSAFNVGIDCV